MSETTTNQPVEFRRLEVMVRMFHRLPPESQRWLLSRLSADRRAR